MNRFSGLILALSLGLAINGCASAGKSSSDDGAIVTRSGPGARRAVVRRGRTSRPKENKNTRAAKRSLGMAILKKTPKEQEVVYKEALGHARAAIKEEPENAMGWFLAGQIYAKLKDYPAADSSFTQAVKLHRGYAREVEEEREEAWIMAYNDALTLYQGGDQAGAIKGFEVANLLYDKRPEASYLLGSLYASRNELEKAVESYKSTLSVLRDPEYKFEDAAAKERWTETEMEVVSNLGMLLIALERDQDAEEVYRDYLKRNPNHLETEVSLAIALTRQEKTAEAAEVFSRISSRAELSDAQLLTVGIGLFNADDFKGAADAFRSASEKNPYSRDAHLNLAKALLRQSLVLEEAKVNETKDADDERLAELYRGMIATGAKVLELDPFNIEVITYALRSHQGLSQILPDAGERSRHVSRLQETVRKMEALPFSIDQIGLQSGEGEVIIDGSFKNLKLSAGTSVSLKFTILSANGESIGSGTATAAAAARDASAPFSVTIPISGEFAGWKYERVQ